MNSPARRCYEKSFLNPNTARVYCSFQQCLAGCLLAILPAPYLFPVRCSLLIILSFPVVPPPRQHDETPISRTSWPPASPLKGMKKLIRLHVPSNTAPPFLPPLRSFSSLSFATPTRCSRPPLLSLLTHMSGKGWEVRVATRSYQRICCTGKYCFAESSRGDALSLAITL